MGQCGGLRKSRKNEHKDYFARLGSGLLDAIYN